MKLEGERGGLIVPVHYNHLLQGFIYRNIHEVLAMWFHEKGFFYGKRRFKMFTFSRLFGGKMKKLSEGKLFFQNPIYFKIGSMRSDILESLAVHLIRKETLKINNQNCRFSSIEVEMPVEIDEEILVKAISPITVYSTLFKGSGKKKTYYYKPWEEDFARLIKENLIRKAIALNGEAPEADWSGFKIEPFKVTTKKNYVMANFKGIWIEGWTGIYKVQIPAPYFEIAYNAGIGSKNSQGFGMLDLWKK